MSSALPAAAWLEASTNRIRLTRSRDTSACAIAPPRSPAPTIPTVVMIGCAIVMGVAGLTGKVAVVTGGSRGIGCAIARALLERGASVAITATTDRSLEGGV